MITYLIAFGLFAASPGGGGDVVFGTVSAPGDRTAVLVTVQASPASPAGIPLGAIPWRQQFDPADHVPFAFDFAALLATGEKIAGIDAIAMSSTAALLGVGVDDADGYGPMIDNGGKKLQLWFVVDEAAWASNSFAAAGVVLPVTVRVVTDSTPPKRFERSALLTVRQL